MGEMTSRRRTHSNAFGPRSDPAVINFLHPIKRRLCSVYAVEVQVDDVLKYGNKLNDGCKVTAAYLDEREEDPSPATSPSEGELSPLSRVFYHVEEREVEDEGEEEGDVNEGEDKDEEAKPIALNGTVRIQWESKCGRCRQSQLFEGLEILEVLRRVGSKWDEEEQED